MKKALFNFRNILALTHDLIAAVLAWYGAFLLRFNFEIPLEHSILMKQTFLIKYRRQRIKTKNNNKTVLYYNKF